MARLTQHFACLSCSDYFLSMGRALIHAVQESMDETWNEEIKDAWIEVYGALSYDMIRAQKNAK